MSFRPTASALALFVLLAACGGASDEAAPGPGVGGATAGTVADALRTTDGVTEVAVDGSAVNATIDAPLPAAGLDGAARARIGEATQATFTASLCQQAGLDAFFAAGGTLALTVRGSDGGTIAEVPVSACV